MSAPVKLSHQLLAWKVKRPGWIVQGVPSIHGVPTLIAAGEEITLEAHIRGLVKIRWNDAEFLIQAADLNRISATKAAKAAPD